MIKRTFECDVMLDCTVSYEYDPETKAVANPEVIALIPIKELRRALAACEGRAPTDGGFARVNVMGALVRVEAGNVEARCEDDSENYRRK